MGISSGSSTPTSALLESLVKAADTDTAKSIKLLKTAMTAEADMVSTLIQSVSEHSGKLNVAA